MRSKTPRDSAESRGTYRPTLHDDVASFSSLIRGGSRWRCGNYWHPRGRGDAWSAAPATSPSTSSHRFIACIRSDAFERWLPPSVPRCFVGIAPREPAFHLGCPRAFRVRIEVSIKALHQRFGQLSPFFFGRRQGCLDGFASEPYASWLDDATCLVRVITGSAVDHWLIRAPDARRSRSLRVGGACG